MTPDLKRLCEAAASECGSVQIKTWGQDPYISEDPAEWENVVRAVLLALREPSEELQKAATTSPEIRYWYTNLNEWLPRDGQRRSPGEELTAMIDHILADPVKA